MENLASKKLINVPDRCVEDLLSGVVSAYPGLFADTSLRIVLRDEVRDDLKKTHVGIVCGGGSGHEPFGAGFVGAGMLTAAVAGSVFASPPMRNCLTAIMSVAKMCEGGVLVLLLNYTGDIINFGQAVEEARDRGVNVDSVVVGEDCALLGTEERLVGRRGLCGTLFVIKIAGALAELGESLPMLVDTCKEVTSSMATIGICTAPCTVPGATNPMFTLADHQMEVGVGIHGEAGAFKINVCLACDVVDILLRKIIVTLSLTAGNHVCAIVNNLGGSSQMEVMIIANEVKKQLEKKSIVLLRLYVGTLVTSLEMGGIQVSLLNVTGRDEWLKLLDANTSAFAWPACALTSAAKPSYAADHLKNIFNSVNTIPDGLGPEINKVHAELLKKCLSCVASDLADAEEELNNLDSGCGDGDTGTTLRHFCDGINEHIEGFRYERPMLVMLELAKIASEVMGGTTGGLYSLMLRGASRGVPDWKVAWTLAMDTVKKYTPATVGSRTMMDALIPAYQTYISQVENSGDWNTSLQSAINKADVGCESTRNMKALLGRASYVNQEYLKNVDAGAYAVTVWLKAVHRALI